MLDQILRQKYKHIFSLKKSLKERPCKFLFDKIFSVIVIIFTSPIFIAIIISYIINGFVNPKDRGSIFTPYIASDRGRKFKKYKFRLVKESLIDQELRKEYDINAYASEWNKENLTYVGRFLKRYYLDELPQILNILIGDISFVGTRPLAWRDYQRDIAKGNVSRKILKAGLFSQTHVQKGTPEFNNLELEYDYIEKYMKFPVFLLLWLDCKIMARGIAMIFKGKGNLPPS